MTESEVLEISVVYSCLAEGVMEVELAIEQAVLSPAHKPEAQSSLRPFESLSGAALALAQALWRLRISAGVKRSDAV